jgi:hypothetical protein
MNNELLPALLEKYKKLRSDYATYPVSFKDTSRGTTALTTASEITLEILPLFARSGEAT